jgi:DNA-binding transcriptional regulator YhcF (GntR family)
MSIKVMAWLWDNATVEGTALLMLLAIADHANDEGQCFPSVATLARKVRVSERQAQRLILQLEQAGAIDIDRGVGRNHTSHYTIKGVASVTFTAEREQVKGDIQREKVTSSAVKGDIAMSPEPLKEPSLTTTLTTTSVVPVAKPKAEAGCVVPNIPLPVQVFKEVTGKWPARAWWEDVALVDDLGRWRTVVKEWIGRSYNPGAVVKMLKVYHDGWNDQMQAQVRVREKRTGIIIDPVTGERREVLI